MDNIFEANLPLPIYRKGKVRDTYDLFNNLLIVATDRISAFDVVLPCPIPYKGAVLNQLSSFWFNKTAHILPNHMVTTVDNIESIVSAYDIEVPLPSSLIGRSMITRKAQLIPVECVVRGYISGSAWEEYKERGKACDISLPSGLQESERLSKPIFTPTTKADSGHDLPLSRKELVKMIGSSTTDEIETYSLKIYEYAQAYAIDRGIIIADTKMEFGIVDNTVTLIDELLTPDSSRFWDISSYDPGRSQASYDKQPVRDWLTQSGWNKEPPAPELPEDVIFQTTQRYLKAYELLTGQKLH